jgi:hypothetical protein
MSEHESSLLGWVVCANISGYLHGGVNPEKFYQGTRMFSPRTKVYIGHVYWGMGGEKLHTIGLRRISRNFVNCAIAIEYLENLRVKPIYSQKLWSKLTSLEASLFEEHDKALECLENLQATRNLKLPPKLRSGYLSEITDDWEREPDSAADTHTTDK